MEEHQLQARQVQERILALREELARLERAKRASRVALLRQGTTRRAVQREHEHTRQQLHAALAERDQAQAAAETTWQEAIVADVAQARAEKEERRRSEHERHVQQTAAALGITPQDVEQLPEWALQVGTRAAMQARGSSLAAEPGDGSGSGERASSSAPTPARRSDAERDDAGHER